MKAAFDAWMAPWKRRISLMVGRAVIAAVTPSAQTQRLQLNLLADETSADLEHFQDYGFASAPFTNAEACVVFVGGDRSHGIIVATQDRRYRLTSLVSGEVSLYDDQGQAITLKRDGIEIVSPLKLTATIQGDVAITTQGAAAVTAQSTVLVTSSLDLGATGGQPVARVGDTVEGGVITSGSASVRSA